MRIEGTTSRPVGTQLGSLSAQSSAQAAQLPTLGQQVQQTLFGRPEPRLLDPAAHPDLAAYLRRFAPWKRKLAMLAGDHDSDYALVLSDDATAAVNADGIIFVGAALLRGTMSEPEALIGVLAHEIGHRPKQWRARRHQAARLLGPDELEGLARHEETRADMFAGAALAELGLPYAPLVGLLERLQTKPHRDYHPVEVRARIIREAHGGRAFRDAAKRKLFPEMHRHTSPGGYVGEF